MMTHITLRVLLFPLSLLAEFKSINFIDVLETLRMKKEVQNSPLLIKSSLLERKLSEHHQIRKIHHILEKKTKSPCQLPLQTGSSKASKKSVVRAGFTDFTETSNCKHL